MIANEVTKDKLYVCPCCGKTFVKPVASIYKCRVQGSKNKEVFLCSWSCYRTYGGNK